MVSNNHNIYDVRNEYTIDQVYLYYEKCIKAELQDYKQQAIITANAMVYASPASDKNSLSKKQRAWESFINSFDLTESTEDEPKLKKGSFFGKNIMIKTKK